MSATNTDERAERYSWDGVHFEDFEIDEGSGAVLLDFMKSEQEAQDENPLIERKVTLLDGALTVYIENEQGSLRRGPWGEIIMHHPYGYIAGTQGVDGDAVDCFLGRDYETAPTVYVVHQGAPDPEDKLMIGFTSAKAAADAFEANYHPYAPEYTMDKISLRELPAKLAKFNGRRITAMDQDQARKMEAYSRDAYTAVSKIMEQRSFREEVRGEDWIEFSRGDYRYGKNERKPWAKLSDKERGRWIHVEFDGNSVMGGKCHYDGNSEWREGWDGVFSFTQGLRRLK